MKHYNPLRPPDPEQWRSIDEQERIDLVYDYHRRARVRLPNATAHAIVHVMVENQIALGDEIPVRRTVQRLISQGLDRHESIHAAASVLVGHMNDLLRGPAPGPEPNTLSAQVFYRGADAHVLDIRPASWIVPLAAYSRNS